MAEYLFKNMTQKAGISGVEISSRGTSDDEEGNPCHYGTKRILSAHKIDCSAHVAKQITKAEIDSADLIVCMDMYDVWSLYEMGADKNKVKRILEFTSEVRDVADPWYTHDFKKSYNDIYSGLCGLLKYVKENR